MKKKWNGLCYVHSSKSKLLLKMKLLTFLLFLSVASIASTTYSQQTKFTLNFEDMTVEQVFQKIEERSEFIFLFSEKSVDLNREISISVDNENINFILDQVFKGTNNYYEINDRQIAILSKKKIDIPAKTAVPNLKSNEQSQKKTISGKVTDSKGEPLPGVTVIVKGTTIGITTDYDGNYMLEVPDDTEILSFSFVGMKTNEIVIGEQTQINVILEEETIGLDEVVAIGYGTQKKSNVTGAISSVKSSDLENRSTVNVASALQGKAAGIHVMNNSGAPGQSSTIRIRGFSSNGVSDPLYIVDGLKVPDIDFLETGNIQSIEILKDGASAAIYGAEAGNGVILITTKTGKKGDGKMFYNGSYTISHLTKTLDALNANDYIQYQRELGTSQDDLDAYYFENPSSYVNNKLADTDWQDVMFNTGYSQRHTLGFQGGNEKGALFISLSYLDNDGILVGSQDEHNRITGQLNGSYHIRDWIEVGITNSLEKSKLKQTTESDIVHGATVSLIYGADPLTPALYSDGVIGASDRVQRAVDEGYSPLMDSKTDNYYGSSYWALGNPLASLNKVNQYTERFNLNGTVYAVLTPFDGFTVTSRLGYRFSNTYNYSYTPPYWLNTADNNKALQLSSSLEGSDYYQWENFANYSFAVKKNEFSVTSGISYIHSKSNLVGAETEVLTGLADNFLYMDYSTGAANDLVSGTTIEKVQLAYYGRLSWSYDSRYNLQFNYRADAYDTSYLDFDHTWGYFPSISGGWTVTNESFMQNVNSEILSLLKVRGSWGKNGSISNLSNYMWSSSLEPSSYYYFMGGVPSSQIRTSEYLANPELRWEESKQFDLGIDMRFFNDRLSVTADYYDKNTEGMLIESTANLTTGASVVFQNVGIVNNHGFEFDFEWKDRIGSDFSYNIKGNLGTVSNEVTKYKGEGTRIEGDDVNQTGIFVTNFEEGYPVWYLRGYKLEGINETDGSSIIADLDNSGDITTDDRTYLGDGIPDFTYGITISMSYKNFDFLVYGTGSSGADIMYNALVETSPNLNRPNFLFDDRWTPDNIHGTVPAPLFQQQKEFLASDALIFDGSFFKIKQIQLGYNFPTSLLNKINVSSLRTFVSLENFFTFTSYPGLDPEARWNSTYNMALDGGGYPVPRSVMFGVNLAF